MSNISETHFQPVVEVDESAALQVEFVCNADVRGSVGHGATLRLQSLILQRPGEIVTGLKTVGHSALLSSVPVGNSKGC